MIFFLLFSWLFLLPTLLNGAEKDVVKIKIDALINQVNEDSELLLKKRREQLKAASRRLDEFVKKKYAVQEALFVAIKGIATVCSEIAWLETYCKVRDSGISKKSSKKKGRSILQEFVLNIDEALLKGIGMRELKILLLPPNAAVNNADFRSTSELYYKAFIAEAFFNRLSSLQSIEEDILKEIQKIRKDAKEVLDCLGIEWAIYSTFIDKVFQELQQARTIPLGRHVIDTAYKKLDFLSEIFAKLCLLQDQQLDEDLRTQATVIKRLFPFEVNAEKIKKYLASIERVQYPSVSDIIQSAYQSSSKVHAISLASQGQSIFLASQGQNAAQKINIRLTYITLLIKLNFDLALYELDIASVVNKPSTVFLSQGIPKPGPKEYYEEFLSWANVPKERAQEYSFFSPFKKKNIETKKKSESNGYIDPEGKNESTMLPAALAVICALVVAYGHKKKWHKKNLREIVQTIEDDIRGWQTTINPSYEQRVVKFLIAQFKKDPSGKAYRLHEKRILGNYSSGIRERIRLQIFKIINEERKSVPIS